jgi:hypothetical protein
MENTNTHPVHEHWDNVVRGLKPESTEGYLLTGGNLFHHQNAYLKVAHWPEGGWQSVGVFVKTAEDFCRAFYSLQFEAIKPSRCNADGKGWFPVYFAIKTAVAHKEAFEAYDEIAEMIQEAPSESNFVDCSTY